MEPNLLVRLMNHPCSIGIVRDWASSLPFIGAVVAVMSSIILSPSVWSWINDDEEHDLVRFRQRLTFVVFWSILLGLFQLRNSKQS